MTDPVSKLVRAMSAKEIVDWLVKHHGLNERSKETVEMNLREQMRWHRLQGRLDGGGWLNFFATLMGSKATAARPRQARNTVGAEMIRNAIRHGAIAFGAAISTGAAAYASHGDAENTAYAVAALAFIFGFLAFAAHAEGK
jgi:hypothetical protein